MDGRLLRLVRALRRDAVPVSTAEVHDAARAMGALGLGDRPALAAALAASLIKSPRHRPYFDEAFARIFPPRLHLPPGPKKPGHRPGAFPGETAGGKNTRGESPSATPSPGSQDGSEHAGTDPSHIAADLIPQGSQSHGDEQSSHEISDIFPGERGDGRDPSQLLPGESDAHHEARSARLRHDLLNRAFRGPWTRRDEDEAASAVEDLARRMALRPTRRQARGRQGRLDVKASLRANLRHGGVPFTQVRRRRRLGRHDLLLLADVSGSVRRAARMALAVLHRLRSRLASVRVFVYTDRPVEVSRLLDGCDLDEAVDAVTSAERLDPWALSDHGEVLRHLLHDGEAPLRRRTVLVVLGDGRNNRFPAQEWHLERLQHKVARLIWLVPEARSLWGTGDSALPRYAPHVDAMLACPTPAALVAACTDLARGLRLPRGRR